MNLMKEVEYLIARVSKLENVVGVSPPMKRGAGITLNIGDSELLSVDAQGQIKVRGQPCNNGDKIMEVLKEFVKASQEDKDQVEDLLKMVPKGEA